MKCLFGCVVALVMPVVVSAQSTEPRVFGAAQVQEVLAPREVRRPFPLVLIHGAAQTATNRNIFSNGNPDIRGYSRKALIGANRSDDQIGLVFLHPHLVHARHAAPEPHEVRHLASVALHAHHLHDNLHLGSPRLLQCGEAHEVIAHLLELVRPRQLAVKRTPQFVALVDHIWRMIEDVLATVL